MALPKRGNRSLGRGKKPPPIPFEIVDGCLFSFSQSATYCRAARPRAMRRRIIAARESVNIS
jgi:hypothetical protein